MNSIQTLTYSIQCNQTPAQEDESLPVLREEVEGAVRNLKARESPRVNNIPFELFQNGGHATTTVLAVICHKIWEKKEWPKE